MDQMSASLIIPVYNSERWLQDCLESAARQTLENIEVVCVDNGSTDRSLEILNERAANDERFLVMREPKPGVSAARNAGLAVARGEYVLFMDADDRAEPDFVEKLVAKARGQQAEVAICAFDELWENPERHVPREICPEEPLYERAFSLADMEGVSTSLVTPNVWRMAFRQDFLESNKVTFPEEIRTSEDLVFIYRCLFAAERIALLPDVLYHYRRDGGESLTRKDRGIDGLIALDLIFESLKEHGEQRPWLRRHFANLALDVLEYQLGSAAEWGEFQRLYRGLRETWRPFAARCEDVLAPRYLPFYEATAEADASAYLFRLYARKRSEVEALSADLSLAREEVAHVRGEASAAQTALEQRESRTIRSRLARMLRNSASGQ